MRWLKVKNGAKYADVSERTFRSWLKNGLHYSKLPSGLILIRVDWIDQYLQQFKRQDDEASRIAETIVGQLRLRR